MATGQQKTWNWTRITTPESIQDVPVAQVLDGRYALKESLGSGSQGQVIQALNLGTGQMVAVKVMTCSTPEQRERARKEIMALRLVRSPYVVPLLDHGEKEQWVYAVMELIEGEPLPKGPVPWVQLKPLFCGLLRGIQTMHNQGLVHRDLKPDNVLLREGVPVLLDLGLSQGRPLNTTMPGAALMEGTPRYAAPEQFHGAPCSPQSDLYALGVMLFEFLSGAPPHRGDLEEIRSQRLNGTAPSLKGQPGVPDKIALLCEAMLERDPALRPPTADLILRILGETDNSALALELSRGLPERSTPQDLEPLFWGQKAYLHIPDDAAQALYSENGGRRDGVAASLLRWLNQGIATYREGRLDITRAQLSKLNHSQDIRGSKDTASLNRLLERCAFLLLYQGKHNEGMEWARQACDLAVELGELDQARRATEWLTYAHLTRQTNVGEFETLLDLEQADRRGVQVQDLCWLVQGQQQLMRGEWERGRAALDHVGIQSLLPLERVRRATMLLAISRDTAQLRQSLYSEEIESWASQSEQLMAGLLQWRGNLAYQEGRWKDAYALRVAAFKRRRYRSGQNSSLISAMNAAIEIEDWDYVSFGLPIVIHHSSERRVAGQLVRAMAIGRSMMVRSDRSAGPSQTPLEEIEAVGHNAAARWACFDAALCWRRGDYARGLELTDYVRSIANKQPFPGTLVMSEALSGLMGAPVDPEALLETTRTQAYLVPELKIQLTGAVAAIRGRPCPELLADLRTYRQTRPIAWRQVRDLCSPAEAHHAVKHGTFPPLKQVPTHVQPLSLPRFL